MTGTGFALDMPAGIPWAMADRAYLTFGGIESFIGVVCGKAGGDGAMTVERTLPIFPMTQDMHQLWEPSEDTCAQLMRRLTEEAQRRGQPSPAIPIERPEPTVGYRRRMARRGL